MPKNKKGKKGRKNAKNSKIEAKGPVELKKKKTPKIPKIKIKEEPLEVDTRVVWRDIQQDDEDAQQGEPAQGLSAYVRKRWPHLLVEDIKPKIEPSLKQEPLDRSSDSDSEIDASIPIDEVSIPIESTDESEPSAGPSSRIGM